MLDPIIKTALRNTFKNKATILIIFLGMLTFLQALLVVYVKCHYRDQYVQNQALIKEQNHLNAQWTQLLIEEGTLGSSARVEQSAQQYLNMESPQPVDMRILHP